MSDETYDPQHSSSSRARGKSTSPRFLAKGSASSAPDHALDPTLVAGLSRWFTSSLFDTLMSLLELNLDALLQSCAVAIGLPDRSLWITTNTLLICDGSQNVR